MYREKKKYLAVAGIEKVPPCCGVQQTLVAVIPHSYKVCDWKAFDGGRASNWSRPGGIQPPSPKITPDEAKAQRDRRKHLDLKRFERLKKPRLETQKHFYTIMKVIDYVDYLLDILY